MRDKLRTCLRISYFQIFLKKDILRDKCSDTPEGNNDSVQESDDDEDEAQEHEEQLHIQLPWYETYPNLLHLRHSIYLTIILSVAF